jgi:hypothetical protein
MLDTIRLWLLLRYLNRLMKVDCFDCALEGKTSTAMERKHLIFMYATELPFWRSALRRSYCLMHGHHPGPSRTIDGHISALDRDNMETFLPQQTRKTASLLKHAENNQPPFLVSMKKGDKEVLSLTSAGEAFTAPSNLFKKLIEDYWGAVIALGTIYSGVLFVIYQLIGLIKEILKN